MNAVPNPGPVGSVKSSSPTNDAEILHRNDDVDRDNLAHHHTLGWGTNQAAPGAEAKRLIDSAVGGGTGEPGPAGPTGPQGIQGPAGPPGPPGGAGGIDPLITWDDITGGTGGTPPATLGFTYVQASPSSMWTINHTLGFIPNVSIIDSSGNEVEGDVKQMSASQIICTFSAAFAGTAYLS